MISIWIAYDTYGAIVEANGSKRFSSSDPWITYKFCHRSRNPSELLSLGWTQRSQLVVIVINARQFRWIYLILRCTLFARKNEHASFSDGATEEKNLLPFFPKLNKKIRPDRNMRLFSVFSWLLCVSTRIKCEYHVSLFMLVCNFLPLLFPEKSSSVDSFFFLDFERIFLSFFFFFFLFFWPLMLSLFWTFGEDFQGFKVLFRSPTLQVSAPSVKISLFV